MLMDLLKRMNFMSHSTKQIPQSTQLYFLERLHRFLVYGYPLLEALNKMKWDPELEKLAFEFQISLNSGDSIDNTFKHLNFHKTIIYYMSFVKLNSSLIESLDKCIKMFSYRTKSIEQIKQTTKYPALLLIIFFFILILIKKFVLPSFIKIFFVDSQSSKTITYSILLIDIVSIVVIILFMGTLILYILSKIYFKKIDIVKLLRIYEKIPVYKHFLMLQSSYYFSLQMSMYLQAGLSMKQILIHLNEQEENRLIQHYSEIISNQLNSGKNIAYLLLGLPFFEDNLAHIFQNNLNTESLQRDLEAYSEFMNKRIEKIIEKAINIIQPIFFIFIALFIVFIYGSLMWPMLQLMQTI